MDNESFLCWGNARGITSFSEIFWVKPSANRTAPRKWSHKAKNTKGHMFGQSNSRMGRLFIQKIIDVCLPVDALKPNVNNQKTV